MLSPNLTPIKIPGKKSRDQHQSGILANHRKRSRPPGRPRKPAKLGESRTSTPSADFGNLSQHRALRHLKSSRIMAPLEKLPMEILSPIFLYCMNLDLPRASPIIAGKLSGRLTIIDAIVNAFSPTWEFHYELIKSDGTTRDKVVGDANLQSAVLRCRCATLSNMRIAEGAWLRRLAVEETPKSLAPSHLSIKHSSRRNHNQTANPDSYFIEEYRSRWRSKNTDDSFIQDFADFIRITGATEATHTSFFSTQWKWTGFLLMHTGLEIPESLLQGPWTAEMVEYLFWLVRADARIHWKQSMSGEVALLGLKTAISTGNLQIMFIFQYLGLGHTVSLEVMKWAFENAGGDKIEVMMRVISMFLYGGNGSSDLVQLQLTAELHRLYLKAQRLEDGSKEKVKATALVEVLNNYCAARIGPTNKKIIA